MSSRLSQLIVHLIDRIPGAGRTQVVKYLYLADLEARRFLGQPLTDLNYRLYFHGPFDQRILSEIDALRANGRIAEETIPVGNRGLGYQYKTVRSAEVEDFTEAEKAIVHFVVNEYGSMPLRVLLEDVVYETTPVRDAKDRDAFNQPLNMSLVDNEARIEGLELERVWDSYNKLDEQPSRPLHEVMDELRSGSATGSD